MEAFTPAGRKEGFYVVVSRLVPYKRVDAVVEAFRGMPARELVVIGDGPERAAHRARRGRPTCDFSATRRTTSSSTTCAARGPSCSPGEEDFGIAPVEAMACGTPVIALGRGGLLETVVEGETGLFFAEPTPEAIAGAVERFEALAPAIRPERCRARAERSRRRDSARSSAPSPRRGCAHSARARGR